MKKIYKYGKEVFGNDYKFYNWLSSEIKALNGVRPISLLDTKEGRDKVFTILVRIAHGVYS